MTYNTHAIATKLNILDSAIIEIQEWASVLFVKFVGGCRFVSKKIGVNKMTIQDYAKKVADLIKGKEWHGANETRVYLAGGKCGYYVIGRNGLLTKNAKNAYNEYSALREAGLIEWSVSVPELTSKSCPVAVKRRTACLNCGITNTILMGRGYCTDCHGEC